MSCLIWHSSTLDYCTSCLAGACRHAARGKGQDCIIRRASTGWERVFDLGDEIAERRAAPHVEDGTSPALSLRTHCI